MSTQHQLRTIAVSLLLGVATWAAPALGQQVEVEAWVEARSADFVVRADTTPERVNEITQTLQAFRSTFAGLAPELDLRSPVPTRILAFRDESSFSSFKSGTESRGSRILGQFLSHPDGNFITLNADPRLLGGVGVVLHEYVHYLVSHNFPGVPRWFNEGLAEYYSTFEIEEGDAVVGLPVRRHLSWLQRHGRFDVAEVLEAGSEPGRHSEIDAGHFYAVSWGLVHYLLSSSRETGDALAAYLSEAGDTAPSRRFEEIFDVRLEDLEAALERYLLADGVPWARVPLDSFGAVDTVTVGAARPADVLNDIAGLVLRLGDDVSAAQFYDTALAYEPENGDALAGLAHVRDLQSRFEDADYLFEQALASDPRLAWSYLIYGRHRLARLDAAQASGDVKAAARHAAAGVQAFRGALDLMPEYAEASALLGYTHLFGGLEPGKGVAPLERAVAALPGRVDLHYQLAQLLVRDGDEAGARRLADGPILTLGGEQWAMRATEEIDRVVLLRQANQALREGRTEEGLELLSRAVQVTSDPDLRARLEADLYRLQESFERASREGR